MLRTSPVAAFLALILAAGGLAAADPTEVASGLKPEQVFGAATTYDPAIPRPADILGYDVGRWHVRHDQLVRYLEVLAEASPRVRLEVQGQSHEGRPQILLTITSPAQQERLEEIRQQHLSHLAGQASAAAEGIDTLPAVLWLGYSIHGDEASGANASLLVAYFLAAGQGPEVESLLEHTVVLLDPSLNPDGLGRFAAWANGHRGLQAAAGRDHREHQQVWPGGRTNHYWFDLNRDWLLLQHPESQARIETFHRWRPHLSGDFHEMGSDGTYFFQPGVPERTNPLIPAENQELTRKVARFHAEVLGEAGALFYTEETFDDFYPGKGSTYPDLLGGVGVLFEQASARGHRQQTDNGVLTFEEAIRHHALTSLSMLRAARELRPDFLRFQGSFHDQVRAAAAADSGAGWVFAAPEDPVRLGRMVEILLRHRIEVRPLARPLRLGDRLFAAGTSFAVPADQDSYWLARTLFDLPKDFSDSTFYDISAWTLPLAFNVSWATVPRAAAAAGWLAEPLAAPPDTEGSFAAPPETYAFLISGESYFSHRTLRRLQDQGVLVRLATRPFEAVVGTEQLPFAAGTLVVPLGGQPAEINLSALLQTAALEDGVNVWPVAGGLTVAGTDLGSPSIKPLVPPRPLLVVGDGVSSYAAGELWHLLDYRFGLELPLVEGQRLAQMDLRPYTHILLADGDYKALEEKAAAALSRWLRDGGTVVATQRGALWADAHLALEEEKGPDGKKDEAKIEVTGDAKGDAKGEAKDEASNEAPPPPPPVQAAYGTYDDDRQVQRISGAIFEARLDRTHPLAFGYPGETLPVFHSGNKPLAPSTNPYENVAVYGASPLLAGYASAENLEKLAGSAAVVASRRGRGWLIRLADDPNFRAFWYGGNKLLLNALFFSSALQETPPKATW